MSMYILSVCNHKGGTGKTTTTIHTAAALGHSGWRTLVIDLDPQGFLTQTIDMEVPEPESTVLVTVPTTGSKIAHPKA